MNADPRSPPPHSSVDGAGCAADAEEAAGTTVDEDEEEAAGTTVDEDEEEAVMVAAEADDEEDADAEEDGGSHLAVAFWDFFFSEFLALCALGGSGVRSLCTQSDS
uniref:Uncharacterized protein n=1 Tax=Chromera velia CCMP2878 TaxID=1169474 RepID=A0A0G4GH61_9ALVE|eukprot:Cvel_21878.t1-p1 / transcript=Cvel_21878.t1 / gene=Cvel_21878 / organism=Chromera_velia_CCMP2878 / gene_product=hypothetical protein / transcript_product=hypothetical protein / location=Cvel_scaffold2091:23150-23464(-) / protein_length=105 / sequence_SO=supercontig / SO=protein_coding / is_pseudo=false